MGSTMNDRLLVGAWMLLGMQVAAAEGEAPEDFQSARHADVVEAVGVLRYFHPHDAVVEVDWNRVLHEGFELADRVDASEAFADALARLVSPIGQGIERRPGDADGRPAVPLVCEDGERPVRWAHEGLGAPPAPGRSGDYVSRRTGIQGSVAPDPNDYATLVKALPARAWRGQELVLSGRIRLPAGGQAVLFVRVDSRDDEMLVFDNMDDRRIDSPDWTAKGLVFPVPRAGEKIVFGMVVYGDVPAEFDGIRLQSFDERTERPVGESLIENPERWTFNSRSGRHQHLVRDSGDHVAISVTTDRVDDSVSDAVQAALDAAPLAWDIELVDGSVLRVPMALCRPQSELTDEARSRIQSRFQPLRVDRLPEHEQARIDVAVIWAAMQHFYPYRHLLENWSGQLNTSLSEARTVAHRSEHQALLDRLLSSIQDSHVALYETDPDAEPPVAFLPLAIEGVGGELIVTVSEGGATIQPGDRVVEVDGEPVAVWMERAMGRESGSLQWRTRRSLEALLMGAPGSSRHLMLERNGETHSVRPTFERPRPIQRVSYPAFRELEHGITHVFLPSVGAEGLEGRIPQLAEAAGVIFDLRGYPNPRTVPAEFLGHLMEAPDDWQGWMQVMLARSPDGDLVTASEHEWRLPTADPGIRVPIVFLADHRALSYAESLVGMVKRHGLGTIIGSHTAGANGNIIPLMLPGGFTMHYTGMRVLGPDGQPFHARGIEPDIVVLPTRVGLREGRDEVLERAIEFLRER